MIRRIWAALLAALGFVILFQLADPLTRGLLWLHDTAGLQVHAPMPNLDQLTAQQPIVGAILFVGGLVLWFMPRDLREV